MAESIWPTRFEPPSGRWSLRGTMSAGTVIGQTENAEFYFSHSFQFVYSAAVKINLYSVNVAVTTIVIALSGHTKLVINPIITQDFPMYPRLRSRE